MNLTEAIAVFDKSSERTAPNMQTEAWAVIREELSRLRTLEGLLIDLRDSGEWFTSALEFDHNHNGAHLYERVVSLVGEDHS